MLKKCTKDQKQKRKKMYLNSSLCLEDASSTAHNKMSEICFILDTKIFTILLLYFTLKVYLEL